MILAPNHLQRLNGNKKQMKPMMFKKINILPIKLVWNFILISFIILLQPSFAQNNSAKKSNLIETINGKKYYLHTVEEGQTLYNISKLYTVTVNEIVSENPETIDGIKIKQQLKIPFNKSSSSNIATKQDSGNEILHKIEKGETLYSLSKQYGIPISSIEDSNPTIKDGFKTGSFIKIPKTTVPIAFPKDESEKEKAVIAPKTKIENFVVEKKEKYHIALLLPFNTESTELIDVELIAKDQMRFPSQTQIALEFYQGILMALDSLSKEDFHAQLFVYDVDEKDSLAIPLILKKPELKLMDLIIGPLYGSSFIEVSKFAKEHEINIVSPFTQQNKILFNNPFVSKVTPTGIAQLEEMAAFVARKYKNENIILLNSNNLKEASSVSAIKGKITAELKKVSMGKVDTLKEVKSSTALIGLLSTNKNNVIILPSNSQVYVTDVISKLHLQSGKYNIQLFGMPSWRSFDNLDLDYLDTLHFHYFTPSYINYENVSTIEFIKKYRSNYYSDPEMYVFQGFDIGMFYFTALKKYGRSFQQKLPEYSYEGMQTSFRFHQLVDDAGYENKYTTILKYSSYKLSIEK